MHQFFYSPPDSLNRYLRFIREHRIKIKILHWDCILFTEFKASYILQLFQTILTFIPPNDTKIKWSLTRYIFDKRTTRFYPSLDPQNRNLNQNRTPFSFSPFPPPPPNPRTNPFETKLSSNFVQLQPPSARPSIRPMKNNQQPLASVLAETKTSSFGRGGGDTGRKGGGEWSWPSEGRGISRPRLGWANWPR